MTVSTIRMTTETMLANSAPPDSETTLGVTCGVHASARDMHRDGPGHGGGNQLQVRHQAGRKMHGADLRAVAELEHGGDQADDEGREEFVDVVQIRALDVADEEPEIERGGQNDEEPEDDLFQIHESPFPDRVPDMPIRNVRGRRSASSGFYTCAQSSRAMSRG